MKIDFRKIRVDALNSDEKERIYKILIDEAHNHGFRYCDGFTDLAVPCIYICPMTTAKAQLHEIPKNIVDTSCGVGLTDKMGGYIFYNGVWAKNISPWFLEEKRNDKIDFLISE